MQNDFDVIEQPTRAASDGPVFSPPHIDVNPNAILDRFFADGLEGFVMTAADWWQTFAIVSFLLSAVLLYGIVYSKIRFSQLLSGLIATFKADEIEWQRTRRESPEHARWRAVTVGAQSDNPNDWRVAIIEADIMLEEVLDAAGFVGATIGDKLKSANRETFRALDDAWAAHKIRNDIAHHGGDFILTKRITNEAIARFERVFQELGAL